MRATIYTPNRSFTIAAFLFVAVAALVLAAFLLGPRINAASNGLSLDSLASRSNAAAADRWQALGNSYAARDAANLERGNAAAAARWQALGNSYAARGATSAAQSSTSVAARLRENGQAYAAQQAAAMNRTQQQRRALPGSGQ